MSAVCSGSADAFARLYDRFCHRAYAVARAVCRDDGQAQEAVQEAFVSIWRQRSSYTPQRGTLAGWVLTVVRYRAVDIARSNARHAGRRTAIERLDEHRVHEDVGVAVGDRDAASRLRAQLARLPDAQCEVIVLAYYGQLTHSEIATELRLPPGTVKGRMRLGLEKLRASTDPAPDPGAGGR